MNKHVYLGLSILDIGKTVMYEFWHDYVKPRYRENAKLCSMDTDTFIVHVKTDALLNLLNNEADIDKIYLYAKYPYEVKYQLLIKKREFAGLKYLNDSKGFIEYSNDMNDIYKKMEDYGPNNKRKILIVFYDIIVDMLINGKLNPILTGLFIKKRKLNICFVSAHNLISLFQKIRLNSTNYSVFENSKQKTTSRNCI